MSLKDIIKHAISENPVEFKESFQDEMNARVKHALLEKLSEATKKEEDEYEDDEEDEYEDDEDDAEDEDEDMIGEMKKLHASKKYNKSEMYDTMKEKYGCSKTKFEGLYASYCAK